MPALMKTTLSAVVGYLGVAPAEGGLRAAPVQEIDLTFDGVAGARHEGALRPSCSRVVQQYPKGTKIRNTRQLSVLSEEEIAMIASDCGLEVLDPGLLGASIVVRGLPDFTHLPPSSRLQAPSGACMVVDMENRPCQLPAREIEAEHAGHGKAFKAAAKGRRGVTCWVERPGILRLGDELTLHIPDQRAWAHLDAVRAGG